jgi:hypothetical protein
MQLLQNELAALNPANRREEMLAHRAGIAVDSMLSHLNRWGQDNLGVREVHLVARQEGARFFER